ncbi:MAG: hypothetical protein IJB63_07115 [Alistipes sp.]|nr:hypothetical protein [Alistipes sp.]
MVFKFRIITQECTQHYTSEFKTKAEALAFGNGITANFQFTKTIPITVDVFVLDENGHFNNNLELVENCGGKKEWEFIGGSSAPALWHLSA